MLDDTVFAKARAEDIRDAPFPHLVLEDALDPSVYDRLARTRPSYPGDPSASNRRLAIPAWMLMALDLYDPVWRALARTHTDRRITDRVAELFADRWPAHLRGVVHRGTRFGVMGRDGYDRADVLTDARLEVLGEHGLEWCLVAKAFARRQVCGEDDVLQLLVIEGIDVEVAG